MVCPKPFFFPCFPIFCRQSDPSITSFLCPSTHQTRELQSAVPPKLAIQKTQITTISESQAQHHLPVKLSPKQQFAQPCRARPEPRTNPAHPCAAAALPNVEADANEPSHTASLSRLASSSSASPLLRPRRPHALGFSQATRRCCSLPVLQHPCRRRSLSWSHPLCLEKK
ncbi:hypothetical protein M0R45_006971 [Rubus argutus]|uniref:Uncharacterized protein n=1 Tax=Rubus argutus TaxID=59490 RepID=A0AAW1YSI7_RUBAR